MGPEFDKPFTDGTAPIYRWGPEFAYPFTDGGGPHIPMGLEYSDPYTDGKAPIYRWGLNVTTHLQMGRRHPYTDGAKL